MIIRILLAFYRSIKGLQKIVNSAIYIDPFVPKVVMVGYDSVFCSLLFSCASPSSMLMFRVNLSLEVYASNDS
jgi:hypothetical protein